MRTLLDARCDTFTDSDKLASYEIKGEEISGDSAKVKTSLTFKGGKTEEEKHKLTKVDGKWLLEL